ncbi:MAG: ABC transporter substrate-binding protein [Bacteriovoracaceae bacterium]
MKLLFTLIFMMSSLQFVSANTIDIGAVFPMTGNIATYGQESINGMKLALKKINKDKLKNKELKLIIEDNKGEPLDSANAVRKLISVDKVVAILGSVASSNTLAGAPIAQKSKTPMLTPASTNEAVTKQGDYISRTCFTDAFQGVVMAKFAYESLEKKKAAIIIDMSSDYSKGLAKVFKKKFKELGGSIINTEFSYQQKDTDFRSLLRKVKRKRPDVIFLPGYYTEVGLILNQARSMGMDLPFLGGDGWDSPKLQELAGEEGIKNNYISSHFSPDDTDPLVKKFVEDYKETYGQNPGAMAALGYDGLLVLADAISRAKGLDSKSIKLAINNTSNFKGVTGTITLNKNRDAQKSAVVLETTKTGNIFKQKVNP